MMDAKRAFDGKAWYAQAMTAERLYALAELYQQLVVELMERTLEKLLRQGAEACQAQVRQLQADLREFEQKYHRSSTEFYQQFEMAKRVMIWIMWNGLPDTDGRQSGKAAASPDR